jgi:hypothetical protein
MLNLHVGNVVCSSSGDNIRSKDLWEVTQKGVANHLHCKDMSTHDYVANEGLADDFAFVLRNLSTRVEMLIQAETTGESFKLVGI